MFQQDRHFHFSFSLMCLSAVLTLVMAGCAPASTTVGAQPPFETYETHDTGRHAVESCMDDNPDPPLSCL